MNTEQRLAQLERQLRWLKRLGALAIAVGAVVVLVAQAKEKEPENLVARSLTITDKNGLKRILLEVRRDGAAALDLYDRSGNETAELITSAGGSPCLELAEGGKRPWAVLAIYRYEMPALELSDREGNTRVSIRADTDKASLAVRDKNGKVIWKAPGE